MLLHFAACVTLEGGCSPDATALLIGQERTALGDQSQTRSETLAGLLRAGLPPSLDKGVDAVRPDLIGEALLLQEMTREDRSLARQQATITRAFGRAGVRVIETVIHTIQDYAEGKAKHPSVVWLRHLAGLSNEPRMLIVLANVLPWRTLAMRELAAVINGRLVDILRVQSAIDKNLRPDLAGWLLNLSNRNADLGQHEKASEIAQQAVAEYRELAAQNPDIFQANLAMALVGLANRLGVRGRYDDALVAAQEAVGICSKLSKRFRPELALALNSLAKGWARSATLRKLYPRCRTP